MTDPNKIRAIKKLVKEQMADEPALFRHACTLYDAFESESEQVQLDDGETYTVYTGFLSQTFARTGISNQYSVAIYDLLTAYDCIAMMVKGARNNYSKVALLRHPRDADIPDSAKAFKKNGQKGLTISSDFDKLSQTVKDLSDLIGGVSIGQLVSEVAGRLDSIEARLAALERNN